MLPGGGKTKYSEIYQKVAAQGIPSLVSKISTVESWLVILITGMVLTGWQFNVEAFKRIGGPAFAAMNPLTAVCFIASTVALLLVRKPTAASLRHWEKRALGLGVAIIGAIVLSRYLLHINFMPDRALFSSKLDVPGQIPNAMAPNTALGFILIGLSLTLLDSRNRLARGLSQLMATAITFLALVALLGFAYGNKALLEFKAFIPIALYSAICFLLLSTAILCVRPKQGFMRLLSSEGGAGFIMRRLLVPVVLLPATLGWLRLQGQKAHLFNTEIGVAITVAINILFGCILIWVAGYVLNKKELEIDRAKDEFLSLAAHQLRTPATSAKMALAMLNDRDAGPLNDEEAKLVLIAVDACDQETQLISNLLGAARLDSGRIILKKALTDLGQLVRDAVNEQQPIIDSRQQHASLDAPPINVVADAARLRMAIDNLVSNASKYTPEGGEFSVRVKQAGSKALVEVVDKGVGMAPDDIPKIFTKFTRLDNPLSKTRGGTGLGMYMVQKITDLHGGNISVTSQPGQGSRFTIELPLH